MSRRYSAKLLFIWNPDPVTDSRRRRLCEERIVLFNARSAHYAVRKAKALGRESEVIFDSGHRLSFAGILQCMELDITSPEEAWWEFRRQSNPEVWVRRVIPAESALYVFTDGVSRAPKRGKKLLRASRVRRKGKSGKRSRAARH